jgi:NarL family two-component system response regulator YdfI
LIRVTIVASALAVRAGLRALLSEDPQFNIITEAANMDEIALGEAEADVMLWAPGLVDLAAELADLEKLNIGETTALLLVHPDPREIDSLVRLPMRAWGILDPEATQAELFVSIQALNEGLNVANPLWFRETFMRSKAASNGIDHLVEPLTGREVEILQLMATGLTNKQIGGKLHISAHTVKFHVSTIYGKLGTTNRVETVNFGLKKGLIVL